MTDAQRERLLGDLVRAGDYLIEMYTWMMARGPDQASPVDDVDTMAAVEDWRRIVDDARREGLVPP